MTVTYKLYREERLLQQGGVCRKNDFSSAFKEIVDFFKEAYSNDHPWIQEITFTEPALAARYNRIGARVFVKARYHLHKKWNPSLLSYFGSPRELIVG